MSASDSVGLPGYGRGICDNAYSAYVRIWPGRLTRPLSTTFLVSYYDSTLFDLNFNLCCCERNSLFPNQTANLLWPYLLTQLLLFKFHSFLSFVRVLRTFTTKTLIGSFYSVGYLIDIFSFALDWHVRLKIRHEHLEARGSVALLPLNLASYAVKPELAELNSRL